jgi:threonine synthase
MFKGNQKPLKKEWAVSDRFSYLEVLKCIDCGREYPPEYHLDCPDCEGLLDPQYDLKALVRDGVRDDACAGMWAYHRVLPILSPEHVVTLGEGGSPLIDAVNLAREIGVKSLFLKYEGTLPTGTVKDRTSATAVSAARQFGYEAISVVSTGNAGVSIANYARRGGIKSGVFCYERGDPLKMTHMSLMATRLFVYRGEYDSMIEHFDRIMERKAVFDGGARRNPYKHEGKKTISYEVVHRLGRAPDIFVAQTSGCEIFTSSFRGFREMRDMGMIAAAPKLVACQSSAANPIVKAFRDGRAIVPVTAGQTVAKGLAAGKPGKKGEWVLRILREQDGEAIEVADEEVIAAQRLLVETEGLWCGPTGVSSLAAICKGVREGTLDPDSTMLCLLTETGLTSPYPPLETHPVETSEISIEKALDQLVHG